MSRLTRLGLVAVGLILLFAGWALWSFQDEYGSGLNFLAESDANGRTVIYEVDEQTSSRTPVFEGSMQEAQEYVEGRQRRGNFTLPAVVLGSGALLLFLAFRLSRRRADSGG